MKVVILGHSGFIGRQITECFNSLSPEIEIIGISRPEIDLCIRESANQIIRHLSPDTTIIMLAAIKKQLGDSMEIYQQNISMIENICEIVQKRNLRQVVYFSSSAVYGEDIHNKQIIESTPVNPRTFYGIAKFTSERLLSKTFQSESTPLAILRPPLIYGSGDASKGYGPSYFLDNLMNDKEIIIWGDGSELREFLYVKDIARIVYDIVQSRFNGVLNPANGNSHSFYSVLNILISLTGKTPKIKYGERTKNKVDNCYSNILFRKSFPEFHFTSLESGLSEMVKFEQQKRGL
ncbi:MAG: NAD-dependent epimerase/dehydratase family protein [Methanoregula sp.]|nr:NAD-dependent epimerase/dehydratase family protein [Methanoregula sp.]